MKANKIMLGDWVNYRPGWIDEETGEPVFDSKKGFPVKIDFIGGEDGGAQYSDEYGSYEMADFEMSPIPLTPEILEKNGFEIVSARDDNAGTMEKYFYPRIGYVYRFSNGEWEVDLIGYGRGFSGAAKYRGVICSVHELQHALRLCGIEKEIVL